jgi:hypothetical protein
MLGGYLLLVESIFAHFCCCGRQGIGAGGGTSGQVLVFHDMLGMLSHPQHEEFVPKFCKKYARVGHAIQDGLKGKSECSWMSCFHQSETNGLIG